MVTDLTNLNWIQTNYKISATLDLVQSIPQFTCTEQPSDGRWKHTTHTSKSGFGGLLPASAQTDIQPHDIRIFGCFFTAAQFNRFSCIHGRTDMTDCCCRYSFYFAQVYSSTVFSSQSNIFYFFADFLLVVFSFYLFSVLS